MWGEARVPRVGYVYYVPIGDWNAIFGNGTLLQNHGLLRAYRGLKLILMRSVGSWRLVYYVPIGDWNTTHQPILLTLWYVYYVPIGDWNIPFGQAPTIRMPVYYVPIGDWNTVYVFQHVPSWHVYYVPIGDWNKCCIQIWVEVGVVYYVPIGDWNPLSRVPLPWGEVRLLRAYRGLKQSPTYDADLVDSLFITCL